ncbi:hypothetical protein GETHOR_05430 [Geothrix oryzae]|jgi:hypothetical protein|uniref:Uncharacterized protein n=1 Tax=Geothrix oryzae TaxID=2927975 RepID=A0ABN6UUM5_9BACT|nr:hypothetical protein [Geothrix oryzae]BDU68442.1 hypothetical protein GETHOR_05430 [Geothrix oryzae]
MQLLDWPFLDALQTGALAALFVSYITDALSRRDRMMGWLALTCLLVGCRHGVLALGTLPGMNPDLVDRAQSLLVVFGFIALCTALTKLFPNHIPPRFPGWIALGMVPNYVRNLVLPHPGLADAWAHHAYNATYLVGCGCIIYWTLRAKQDGDPLGRRLFLGFIGVTLPVVIEIAAHSLFGLKIRLSGFSLVILAMAIGTSWQWFVVHAMESRIHRAETEVEVWRSLVPGNAFRTDRPSALMENLFGTTWADRVRESPDLPLLAVDGVPYRLKTRVLYHHERLGWYERDGETQPGARGFLSGWTVALGMDDPASTARVQAWLREWGAEVQLWGTMPPREGPYPSVLIWAREPSILAVWREGDIQRRRPRWVQVGGPTTEGPHARLEGTTEERPLRELLQDLLSRR